MRLNDPPRTIASVRTVSVLARPGTPSSSTWPPVSSATSTRSSMASWPITTRLDSYRADSRERRTLAAGSMSSWVMGSSWSGTGTGSDEPPAQADRDEGGQGHDPQPAAGEEVRDLLLLPVRGDLGAEPLVHLVERVGVL